MPTLPAHPNCRCALSAYWKDEKSNAEVARLKRKKNTEKISDVIQQIFQQNNLQQKLDEVDIMQSWEKVLGSTIKNYTSELIIKNGVLYVKLSSSVLRNELMMTRSKLIASLNEKVGKEVIKDIVFR